MVLTDPEVKCGGGDYSVGLFGCSILLQNGVLPVVSILIKSFLSESAIILSPFFVVVSRFY